MANHQERSLSPAFTKLQGDANWPLWKSRMQLFLEGLELWGFIDGTEPVPVAAEDLKKHKAKSAKIQYCLQAMLEDSIAYILLGDDVKTPKDSWEILVKKFDSDSLSNKVQLYQRLSTMKMRPGMTSEEYFAEFQEVRQRLARLKVPAIDDDFAATLLLNGLPDEFAMLRTSFLTKGSMKITELQEAIRTEESRREKPEHSTIMTARESGHPGQFNRRGGSSRGNGRRGRGAGSFRGRGRGGNSGGDNSSIKCYKCLGTGHYANECPSPSKHQGQSNRAAFSAKEEDGKPFGYGNFSVAHEADKVLNKGQFIIDSGATAHMVQNKEIFHSFRPYDVPREVTLGDSRACKALGEGDFLLANNVNGRVVEIPVLQALYVPKLMCNFLSVKSINDNGKKVVFENSQAKIFHEDGETLLGTGRWVKRHCILDGQAIKLKGETLGALSSPSNPEAELWHRRFGHCPSERMQKFFKGGHVRGLPSLSIPRNEENVCEGCVQGKMRKLLFPTIAEIHSTRPLDLIHSDVLGPITPTTLGGKRYIVTFVDDYSRYCTIAFLALKSEVFKEFKDFKRKVENQHRCKIRAFRTDNGGEFCSDEFERFLKQNGIHHQKTVPYCPQQNGVAERRNGLIQQQAISMEITAGAPKIFWAEASYTAVYLQNRMVTETTGVTPFLRWTGRKPSVAHLRVFGCEVYALKPQRERSKFSAKADKCIMLGYPTGSKGYRLLDPSRRSTIIRRDVKFNETVFPWKKHEYDFGEIELPIPVPDLHPSTEEASSDEEDGDRPNLLTPTREASSEEENGEDDFQEAVDGEVEPTPPSPKRSNRATKGKAPERYGFESGESGNFASVPEFTHCLLHAAALERTPTTIEEALQQPDGQKWEEAAAKKSSRSPR
jgi:hypothetical protein